MASSSTHAGASGPTWATTLSRQADATATISCADGFCTRTPPAGAATETPRRRSSDDERADQVDHPRRRADRVLLTDQGPQRVLLLAGEAAELRAVGPEVGPAALHQGQDLEHAVVDRAGQPQALGRGGRRALGRGRPARRAQQRVRP